MGNTEQLLTPEQLAERLQIPLGTLYRWRSRGEGPPGLRCGRHLRYRPEDVRRWEAERVSEGSRG